MEKHKQGKSGSQMGFETTTLRDTAGCSKQWATGDSMVSEGQFAGQVCVSPCINILYHDHIVSLIYLVVKIIWKLSELLTSRIN